MRKGILASVLGIILITVGCSTAWLVTFDNYLKVVGPVLIQVVDLIALKTGKPVNAALIAQINQKTGAASSAAQAVQADVNNVQNLPGACQKLNASVQDVSALLPQIETLANISNVQTQTDIAAGLSIGQAIIAEVEIPITSCQTAPSTMVANARLRATLPRLTTPEEFVKKFNAVVDKKHQVHLHGKFARVLTFGRLQ